MRELMKRFVQTAIILLLSSTCHNAYAKSAPLVLSSGIQCNERHPIECAIRTLQPLTGAGEARLLSNLISKYSLKYKVDPLRVVAIAMQESGLRNVDRIHGGIVTDVGIYQFNILTIDSYGMDAVRLKNDIAYATERMCWLLSIKLKECSDLGKDAWACYHSRTDKHRLKYINLVDKYYKGINYESN